MIYAPVDHVIKNTYCWFRRFCLVHFFDAKRPNFGICYTHAHIPGDSYMVTDTTADESGRFLDWLIHPREATSQTISVKRKRENQAKP